MKLRVTAGDWIDRGMSTKTATVVHHLIAGDYPVTALDDQDNPVGEGGKASWMTADVASIRSNTAAVVRVRTYAIAAFAGALTLNGLGEYINPTAPTEDTDGNS